MLVEREGGQTFLPEDSKNGLVLVGMHLSRALAEGGLFETRVFGEVSSFLERRVSRFSSFHDTVVFGTQEDLEFFFFEKRCVQKREVERAISYCSLCGESRKKQTLRENL
jgi:hypothetical protein